MPRPRMRPTFEVEAGCERTDLIEALRAQLEADRADVVGTVSARQCALAVVREERRFWTPSLDLAFDDASTTGARRTRIWGTFSPRPEIWTAYVFAIGTLVIASLFAGMYGLAQLALGHAPTALAVPAAAAVAGFALYLSALIGQGLSIAEMYRLRAFVDDCLRVAEAAARDRVHDPDAAPTRGAEEARC